MPKSFYSYFSPVKSVACVAVVMLGLLGCADNSVDKLVSDADVAIQSEQYKVAIVYLKNAVQQEPRNAALRFKLGTTYLATNDFPSAAKELNKALALGHSAVQVIPYLAQAMQRSGADVALSELDFEQSTLTNVEKLEVGYRKVAALVALDQTQQAKDLIYSLTPLESSSVYKGLLNVYAEILNDNDAKALELAQQLHKQAPLNRDVLRLTARLYSTNKNDEQAANVMIDYIRVANDDLESKFELATLLTQLGRTSEAETYVDQLLDAAAQHPLLNQLKSIARLSEGDFSAAKEHAEKAINAGSTDDTLRYVAGIASYQLEEYQEAIAHLSFIASKLPDNHPGLRVLAASQLRVQNIAEAGQVLQRLDTIEQSDVTLLSAVGSELIKAGDVTSAQNIINKTSEVADTTEDHIRLGELKLSINNIDGILDLEEAVKGAPERVDAKKSLAQGYIAVGQLNKALEVAEELKASDETLVAGLLIEAEVLQQQQNDAQAQVLLGQAAALQPDNTDVLISQVKYAMRQQDIPRAAAKTDQLLAISPLYIPALETVLVISASQDQLDIGLQRVQEVLQQNPNNADLAVLVGKYQLIQGQPHAAIETLETIAADKSAPIDYWQVKGAALIANNQLAQAEQHYKTWTTLYPYHEQAVLGLSELYDRKYAYEQGLLLAEQFLRQKFDPQVALMKSYFSVMQGQPETAKRVLQQLDENSLATPFARGIFARLALIERRPEEALADAKIAFDARSSTANLFLYVQALDENNQGDKAYSVLNTYTENSPTDIAARILLGERQINRDPDAAIANYQDLLTSHPDNWVALNNLSYLLMQKGQIEQAKKLSSRAYELNKSDVGVADTYAQILMAEQEYKKALSVYESIMTGQVSHEEVLLHYIEALLRSGQIAKAKRRISEYRFYQPQFVSELAQLKQEFKL